MSITVQPLREGRVLLCTYGESFTVAEVIEMTTSLQQDFFAPATHKVYTIYDFTALKRLPPNVLSRLLHAQPKPHPMAGLSILVTTSAFFSRMIDVLAKLIPPDMMMTRDTVEEALAELDRRLALETEQQKASNSRPK